MCTCRHQLHVLDHKAVSLSVILCLPCLAVYWWGFLFVFFLICVYMSTSATRLGSQSSESLCHPLFALSSCILVGFFLYLCVHVDISYKYWISESLCHSLFALSNYCLIGLVLRRPPRERKIPGSNPACAGIFFGVKSYQ